MDNKEGEVKCLMNLGLMYWNIDQRKDSSEKYKQAQSLAQKLNLKDKQKECQYSLKICKLYEKGKSYRSAGEFQKSTESIQRACDLSRKIESKEHEVKCLRQLSSTYWRVNNLQEFFSLAKKALNMAKSLNHRNEIGRCLNNIGLHYSQLNNYSKALSCYKDAIEIAKKEKDKSGEGICLTNIGLIYRQLGKYDKALEYYTKALKIDQDLEKWDHICIDLNNIGIVYRAKGHVSGNKEDFDTALYYLYECLKLARKIVYTQIEVVALNNIGFAYINLKKYSDALRCLKLGNKKAKKIDDFETMSMILTNMGIVHYNQGNYEESKRHYKKAIEFANKKRAGNVLWEAYFELGKCYEKIDDFPQAVKCYKESISTIDYIRSRIFLDTYKAGFVRDKLEVYEHLVDLLYQLNRNDPAKSYGKELFHIVERAKARAFLESLGESIINVKESLSPELKAREREISSRISLVMKRLSTSDLTKKMRRKLFADLQYEEDEYMNLISKMRVEAPEIANLVSPEPCQVEQVQKLLDEKTALIEYFLGEQQSVVFSITKSDYEVFSLPSRSEIEKSIKAYLKILSDSPRGKFGGIPASKRIYEKILSPTLENIPKSIENLIIVPDGMLYYLPFETLMPDAQNQSSENNYLIENYKVSYIPSSSALLFLSGMKTKHEGSKGLLAFGNPSYTLGKSSKEEKNKTDVEIMRELYLEEGFDFSPLPYSKKEILEISKYFPEKKREIYVEKEAKEETFKNVSLKNYQVIHFACHGFMAEKFPFRSALVLSLDEDPKEDGFLQVRELYNLRMKADLVVLSACQTGKGKLERGEGILGLPRIFFYTGARSVISTLWKITDESTAKFMDLFYRYLAEGNDKSQALRLAKLEMIDSKYSHPFYWAAFVLNGDFNSTINFR
ncbi:MAG: CHAT domain-containing protein [Candidatus Aminicenantes bacterium]|nr:CHAT domain-containing protein [Candidatus Aminicenantes bacterium]